ncbi:MAG: DUF5686 family protein, partial [Bacteroidota bacterium]|nr:DUF5686 family protein [Bacteroidota bacterium]
MTIIKGEVTDAKTNEPLPFVSVVFVGKAVGALTDFDGKYVINSKSATNKIKFSCVGYKTEIKAVKIGQTQIINCQLSPEIEMLEEVVIKPGKVKYRNKNNPAVELINNVIENKSKNRMEEQNYMEYEKYEKILFALSNLNEKFKQKRYLRKFQFIFNNIDTTKLRGKEILPFYMKESISDFYYRKNPKATKEIVKANKMVNFEGYIDKQGLEEYLKYLYQHINIYDNNITLLTNQFLSPIAGTAPIFYKYFINDTIYVDSVKCVKVFFSPRNKMDLMFQGFFYIALDSSYAVKKIDMSVNSNINLNWVKELKIIQDFDKTVDRKWILKTDELYLDFGIVKNKMGIFGQRSVSYKNYQINRQRSDSTYSGINLTVNKDAEKNDSKYWDKNRFIELNKSEKGTYEVMDSVKKIPAFRRTMDILFLILQGYWDFGYFDVGPVSTFYSYNPIEGFRIRFGGRTTLKFSKKFNIETYLAYGFKDEKPKYYLGGTYALSGNNVLEFPLKTIKLSYQDETKIPGQELQFVQEDNILLSIKRGVNDKLFYNKTFKVEHINEFYNHFSYTIGYQDIKQNPAGSLFYNSIDYMQHKNTTDILNISEVYLNLRYAPNEQFYQGKSYRIPIYNKYPILQLQYSLGLKNLLNNDYNYHKGIFTIDKRFYMSIFGFSDATFEFGKVFGKVSYPEMFI